MIQKWISNQRIAILLSFNKHLKCILTTIFEIYITIFWSRIQDVWNLIQDQTNFIRNEKMQLNLGIILMALLFCCVSSCPGSRRRRPGMYTAKLHTKYISPKIVQCSGITYLNLDSSGSNLNTNTRESETNNPLPPPNPVVTQPKIPCCPIFDHKVRKFKLSLIWWEIKRIILETKHAVTY